ncbi:hypothetical protein EsDP_00006028 [Epichloe bromicola]|uniref:HMG box domain-containing protein n=1 Tax=Epichloe bromicola TaxID=79588 RepID=A0ABQ0CWF2_9HYPO
MKGTPGRAAAESAEPHGQELVQSIHSNQSTCRSRRISPDLHVTDMDINSFPYEAKEKNCPDDKLLSKSRNLTPVQGSNYESFQMLDKALSESAKQYPDDFIDPVAYACRSIEERKQKSIEEGKVSRPLNSYMLYRKAYQQVARRVIRKDQQQSASQTVGASWTKLECDEIKSRFRALAKIDHEKHLEAFPTYRYTPAQGKNSRCSPESRKTMITERKSLRRSGQRITDPKPIARQASIPMATDALLGDQRSSNGSDWWFRERQDYATPFSQIGNMYDYSMPNSTHFGVQFADEVSEHPSGHLSRHAVQAMPGPLETVDFDHFIDPSLWSRFEGANPQCSAPCLEWQGRNTTGQERHPFMPEITTDLG